MACDKKAASLLPALGHDVFIPTLRSDMTCICTHTQTHIARRS